MAMRAMEQQIANGTFQTVTAALHTVARPNTLRRLGNNAESAPAEWFLRYHEVFIAVLTQLRHPLFENVNGSKKCRDMVMKTVG